jgi:hypothetical protein
MSEVLGWIEFLGVPIALVWLIVVVLRMRSRRRPAMFFSLALAVTVAQPFGVVATPTTQDEFDLDRGGEVSMKGFHLLHVGPIPSPPSTSMHRSARIASHRACRTHKFVPAHGR